MRNIAITIIAVTLAGAPAYAASSVTGSWDVVVTTMQGAFPSTITFTETDDGYTVTIDDGGAFGPPQISDVSIGDNDFSFKRMLDLGQGPIAYVYSGTVDGDTMSGKVASSVGPMTLTGTRKGAVPGSGQ